MVNDRQERHTEGAYYLDWNETENADAWHTSRHSFVTLPKANGEDVKTVQELLRHANSKSTLDVYTHAVKPFPPRSD